MTENIEVQAFAKIFGLIILKARKKAGLTQKVCADHLGISRTAMSNIERGASKCTSLLRAMKLFRLLNIDLNKFEGLLV